MRKGVIAVAVVVGMGMLYAQAASAGEMVRYEHSLYMADASEKTKKTDKSAHHKMHQNEAKDEKHHQHHHKHHHKHHHHKHAKHHHHHKHHAAHHRYHYYRDRDEGIRIQSQRELDQIYGPQHHARTTSTRKNEMQEYASDTMPDHR